jgi:hypothetical protein
MARPFYLVVVDRDKSRFSVQGPMVDDTGWDKAVVRAQEQGRRVNCITVPTDRDSAIEYWQKEGFTFVDGGIVYPISD